MKIEIKEKLLKEIEEDKDIINWAIDNQDNYSKGKNDRVFIKEVGRMLIKKAIEETSKAKDEEFIKILDELQDDVDALQIHHANLDECEKVDVWELIEEIKQNLKEKEE